MRGGKRKMKDVIKISMASLFVLLIALVSCSEKGLKKGAIQERITPQEIQYIIGPEDVLQIHVWKEPALSATVPVRIDGKISLPLLHDVQAAGLTPLQLQESLVEKLKDFIENPNVSVTVTDPSSFKVFVSGEVRSPGVFKLRTQTTLFQIIPLAGGFTEWANPKKILIIRNEGGKERRFTVNYKRGLKGKDPDSNFTLKPGDTIIIP